VAKLRRRLIPLLSALLLFSQHVALTHALWHQVHGLSAQQAAVAGGSQSHGGAKLGRLCDFDAMLGQLLAGGAVAADTPLPSGDGAQALCGEAPRFAALAETQPRSRGPPSVL
jgi:hypothetical protein